MKTQKIPLMSIILISALIIPTLLSAQEPPNRPPKRPAKEKIEARRIAFLTTRLDLTPDEAKVFWPVYNEFDAKRLAIRRPPEPGETAPDMKNISEKEAEKLLQDRMDEAQKMFDLRKEYHNKFRAVLPASKVLKLYDAERDFQKVLIDKMNGGKPGKPDAPNKPGRGPKDNRARGGFDDGQ